MKLKQYPSANFIIELKIVCNKIIEETSPKSRARHPLWNSWIDTIENVCNYTFENFCHKPPAQKLGFIAAELNREVDPGYITCACCGIYRRHDIRQHIRASHKLTVHQYKELYGSDVVSDQIKAACSKRISGDKNPGWKHDGKFSALSKNNIKYAKLSNEEAAEQISKTSKRISEALKKSVNIDTKIEYYTSRGFTQEEAIVCVKKRQTTFSLEKLIEKYGNDEGHHRWNKRQQKWQESLNNKSQEEIKLINRKKGLTKSGKPHVGGFFNEKRIIKHGIENDPCILYYVKFISEHDTIWKIGIAVGGVDKRFASAKHYLNKFGVQIETIFEKPGTIMSCFKYEQQILKENSQYRINFKRGKFSTTEAFSCNIIDSINTIIDAI